jgi:hypothetical protein
VVMVVMRRGVRVTAAVVIRAAWLGAPASSEMRAVNSTNTHTISKTVEKTNQSICQRRSFYMSRLRLLPAAASDCVCMAATTAAARKRSFPEFSLHPSRACLGKMIVLSKREVGR